MYKKLINDLLIELRRIEAEEIYDTDQLILRQNKINLYLNRLNILRYLDYNNVVLNEISNFYIVQDEDDIFRVADGYYNDYQGAEEIILNNDINDIQLEMGQILRIR